MQLRSGHVTLLRAEFQPLELSPQSDLRPRAASGWAMPQIVSFFFNFRCNRLINVDLMSLECVAVCMWSFGSICTLLYCHLHHMPFSLQTNLLFDRPALLLLP